jgi:hypothetical protein
MAVLPSRKPARSNPEKWDAPRIGGDYAGYMELEGASKDAECAIVQVKNGISRDRGCCNLFDPSKGVAVFSCGTCEYVRATS